MSFGHGGWGDRPWKELEKPRAWQLLTDGETADLRELVQGLVEAHEAEAQRRGGDPKFSQHHEGRHAGQSGCWWLAEAATEEGARLLSTCAGRLAEVLPVFGWKPPAVAAGGRPGPSSMVDEGDPTHAPPPTQHRLTDSGITALLRAGQAVFPMPGGKAAGEYTSMDLGRLSWTVAVLLGLTEPVPLGKESFDAFVKMQGRNTQRTQRERPSRITMWSSNSEPVF